MEAATPEALSDWGLDLWLRLGVLGLIGLVLAYALYRLLTYRRKPPEPHQPDLAIYVASLPALHPPVGGPGLHLTNVPMRLAVVVLAPAGRIRELPPARVAVVTFSGLAGERKVAEKTDDLLRWIQSRGFTAAGKPQLARYNPPWTLPFLRRNEVQVELK